MSCNHPQWWRCVCRNWAQWLFWQASRQAELQRWYYNNGNIYINESHVFESVPSMLKSNTPTKQVQIKVCSPVVSNTDPTKTPNVGLVNCKFYNFFHWETSKDQMQLFKRLLLTGTGHVSAQGWLLPRGLCFGSNRFNYEIQIMSESVWV